MRLKTIFLLCITLSGFSIQTEAQEAIYVYGQGACNAVDIHNVNEIRMTEELVDIAIGVNYKCTDIDSITFKEPEVDYGRIGWWGSPADGPSACYYQSFHKDYPDMTFEATDSICTSAFIICPMKSLCFSPVGELAGNGDMSRIPFLVIVSFKSVNKMRKVVMMVIIQKQKWMKTGGYIWI